MYRCRTLILLLLIIVFKSEAQLPKTTANRIFNFQFLYNYHIPSADLKDRFGNFSAVGFGGHYKTRTNWTASLEGNFLFGSEIKELNMFNNLVTTGGFIASSGGSPGNYSVAMRGASFFISGGKLFPLNKRNPNSGLLMNLGVGYLQHKIYINSKESNIPQFDENYIGGYDRFTNGIAFREFLGYGFHSQNRLINFYVGIELMQGFTKNRRGYNYDQMAYDKKDRDDRTWSLRFGWLIPMYLNTREEDDYQFR